MSRTNYILLAFGLVAALALSFMMQHLLRVTKDQKSSPVAQEVFAAFGMRMTAEPKLEVTQVDGRKTAILSFTAFGGIAMGRLAKETGTFLWRRLGKEEQLEAVLVRCTDELDGKTQVFPIPSPFGFTASLPSSKPASRTPASPK